MKENLTLTTATFKELAQQVKLDKWEAFCQLVCREKSRKRFWELHRSMNGTHSKRSVRDFQSEDQSFKRTDEEKGNALTERYIRQTDAQDRDQQIATISMLNELCSESEMTGDVLISLDDINATIKASQNSAPGPDGIRYEDFGRLHETDLQVLCDDYNNSTRTGSIPDSWLYSNLIPLAKPGKNDAHISGYRIITMQNTIGKITEKMVSKKIANDLEMHHLLPDTLGGYRRDMETWRNASVFAQDVYKGFHVGLETCAVAIDLEDAYNKVSFHRLISQLLELELHPLFVRWISIALFERKVVLRCGGWSSELITINPGLPQGSPLSPVLFNVYTIQITGEQLIGTGRTLSYADDILVYRQGKDRSSVTRDLQKEVDRIAAWCDTSGATVNPSKATTTWFSLNNRVVNTTMPIITLCGREIERTSTMNYLGVKFDRGLNFKDHLDNIITKARKGLAALKVMASINIEQRLLVLLYHGLVLSIIEYALAILTVSTTQIDRLEKINNEAMRIILGCTRDTSCCTMRYLLDFPTMGSRVKLARARDFLRVKADIRHPLHAVLAIPKGNRLKRGKSWMGRAEEAIHETCRPVDINLRREWLPRPTNHCTSISVLVSHDRSCTKHDPARINTEISATIDDNTEVGDAVVFTDGSVIRGKQSAWAFSARSRGKTVMEASGAFAVTTSSLTMETIAVTKALNWLGTQTYAHACILSDSMNMLMKVKNSLIRQEWLDSLITSCLTRLTFIYVPGHAGVEGNERADRLASIAVIEEGRSMDSSDIINAIRERDRSDDFGDADASASLTRVRTMGVKLGAARHEHFTGRTRRLINQHRTGTISRFTLVGMLRRSFEHLWTCPECNDDDSH